jgi:signal transduction histidine kinase
MPLHLGRAWNAGVRAESAYGAVAVRMEERMAVAVACVRCAMVVLVFVPLGSLLLGRGTESRSFASVLAVGLLALGEAVWLTWRLRRTGTTADPGLVAIDVLTSLLLMVVVSRTLPPQVRAAGMTPYLSFTLVSAGLAGLGLGASLGGITVPVVLAVGWSAAVWPDVTAKLVSDCLGYGLWFITCVFIAREFRGMALVADQAQKDAEAAWTEAAEQRRIADLARERDRVHHEIHDRLLPIVDAVASGSVKEDAMAAIAREAAQRARATLLDGRSLPGGSLAALLAEVRDRYIAAGLGLSAVLRIDTEPPPEVATAIAAAASEALSNTLKYAHNPLEVTLFAEATERGVEVVVRDRGCGFIPQTVRPGGGFAQTYPSLRRLGGDVRVDSAPNAGTKVIIRWAATTHAADQPGEVNSV